MIELLFVLVSLYLASGVAFYLYIVIRNYEFTEIWDFKIGVYYIGICPYPKWLLWWLRKLQVAFKWK